MTVMPAIFSLWVAAAGWYYMFYSRAAGRLAGIEDDRLNLQRVRLRRVGGFVMLLLAVFFFAGFHSFDLDRPPTSTFFFVWLVVFLLLGMVLLLGLIDLRLTMKLRKRGPRV